MIVLFFFFLLLEVLFRRGATLIESTDFLFMLYKDIAR